jgi:hypothetical protein
MYLYKYRDFSKCNLDALCRNELYFARGLCFNDLFDCTIHVPIDLMDYERYKYFIENHTVAKNLVGPKKEIERIINSLVINGLKELKHIEEQQSIKNHPVYDVLLPVRASLVRSFAYCLSEDCVSDLMWAYYGGSHKGFCIKFNKEIMLKDVSPQYAQKVVYEDNIVNIMDALNNGDFLSRDVLFKKSARWQHENEFRLIHSDLADDDHDNIRKCNYSDEAIECIIF